MSAKKLRNALVKIPCDEFLMTVEQATLVLEILGQSQMLESAYSQPSGYKFRGSSGYYRSSMEIVTVAEIAQMEMNADDD